MPSQRYVFSKVKKETLRKYYLEQVMATVNFNLLEIFLF